MAIQTTITPLPSFFVDGRQHRAWDITHEGTPDGTEADWALEGLPVFFTITLFQAVLPNGIGTFQPRLTTAVDTPTGGLDEVVTDEGGSSALRNDCPVRVTSPCGRLYGWSQASSAGAQVALRISIVDGHQA